MLRSLAPLFAVLALGVEGCTVSAGVASSSDLATNQCQTDADCGAGLCIDKICRGSNGQIKSLLVAVTPQFTGMTFYQEYTAAGGSLPSGGSNNESFHIDPPLSILGHFYIDVECTPSFVQSAGGSPVPLDPPDVNHTPRPMPADVTFTPSGHLPGLPTEVYRGVLGEDEKTRQPNFSVRLPPGPYDISIRPYPQVPDQVPAGEDDGTVSCPVPPRLLLNQKVTGNGDFTHTLTGASTLQVNIVWAKPDSPVGWVLDLVDPSTGQPLALSRSIKAVNVDPAGDTMGTATYSVDLSYAPPRSPDKAGMLQPLPIGTAVLRLSPPDGVTAPVLMAQLSGAQVGNDPTAPSAAVLRQSKLLPAPVTVNFTTELEGTTTPVPATVTLTASEVEGVSDLFTSFSRKVAVDATGAGTVDLLPGTYRVVANPTVSCEATDCLALQQTTWLISADSALQSGRTLDFSPMLALSGRAVLAKNSAPAVGATVRALPSAAILDSNVMNAGDASSATVPRANFDLIDTQGDFALRLDPGTFDVRVEPDPATSLGWFVKPKVPIGVDFESDLGRVVLPLPVVYHGRLTTITDGIQTTVPSALIGAYVYLDANGELTTDPDREVTAVQVAETHADPTGSFTLLVPSSINQ